MTTLRFKTKVGWLCATHEGEFCQEADNEVIDSWGKGWCGSKRWVESITGESIKDSKGNTAAEVRVVYDENNHIAECCVPLKKTPLNRAGAVAEVQQNPEITPLKVLQEMQRKALATGDMEKIREIARAKFERTGGSMSRHGGEFRNMVINAKRAAMKNVSANDPGDAQTLVGFFEKLKAGNPAEGKFLQFWSSGDGRLQNDTEWYFFMSGCTDKRMSRRVRDRFSQVELALQCQEGGRLYDAGIHLDDTHNKIDNWLIAAAHTYDKELGRVLDLCYLVCRRTNARLVKQDTASSEVYETLMKCMNQKVAEYLGVESWKSRYRVFVVDAAGEITTGVTKAMVDHDSEFYLVDSNGNLINHFRVDSYHYGKSTKEVASQLPKAEGLAFNNAVKRMNTVTTLGGFKTQWMEVKQIVRRLHLSEFPAVGHLEYVLAFWVRRFNHVFGVWGMDNCIQEHSAAEPAHWMWMARGVVNLGLMRGAQALVMMVMEQSEWLRAATNHKTADESLESQAASARMTGRHERQVAEELLLHVALRRKEEKTHAVTFAALFYDNVKGSVLPSTEEDDLHSPKPKRVPASVAQAKTREDIVNASLDAHQSVDGLVPLEKWPAMLEIANATTRHKGNGTAVRSKAKPSKGVEDLIGKCSKGVVGEGKSTGGEVELVVLQDSNAARATGSPYTTGELKGAMKQQMAAVREVVVSSVKGRVTGVQYRIGLGMWVTCSCPAFMRGHSTMRNGDPCKHIVQLLMRHMGLPPDDTRMRQTIWTLKEAVEVMNTALVVASTPAQSVGAQAGTQQFSDVGGGREPEQLQLRNASVEEWDAMCGKLPRISPHTNMCPHGIEFDPNDQEHQASPISTWFPTSPSRLPEDQNGGVETCASFNCE